MTQAEKVTAITERVTLDLMDHMDDLDKHGRAYIRAYVESILGKPTTHRPPCHFHPKLAELVRELASDAALSDRRPCGTASPVSTRDGALVPVGSSRRKTA